VKYLVQLPPEYDPYRRYPAVVTLHGAGTPPEYQIDWWAGKLVEGGWRAGQASRQGYIVIAPDWTTEHQKQYGYTAREHAAVLDTLRDACRRFAIDTDRVFLSGHSMGGDAAWDLGLAHPDLWAGVIPIVAQSDRYCAFYADNAKLVPFYFVAGELDGGRMNKNARDLDRYMAERGYNCTVVEYLGRGHEYFSDEVLRIFDWMGRFRRNFFPREFKCSTMRPWDNFFWWVELRQLPARAVVDPADWPPPPSTRAAKVEASVTKKDGIYLSTGAGHVTIWLSPDLLDIDRRMNIVVNGRRISTAGKPLTPDLATLLEDVRTRGDRQHPFWVKLEAGRGGGR
jgi:pimeloyl-ACP methyl ester carboxylesterase